MLYKFVICYFGSNSLPQASSFGIDFNLVRISVGLEDAPDLRLRVQHALDAVAKVQGA